MILFIILRLFAALSKSYWQACLKEKLIKLAPEGGAGMQEKTLFLNGSSDNIICIL